MGSGSSEVDTESETSHGEIVVTWPGFDIDNPASGLMLHRAGLSIRLEPKTGPRSAQQLRDLLGDSVAVIASTDPSDAQTFETRTNLKVIARTGVGVDSIDMEAAVGPHRVPSAEGSVRIHGRADRFRQYRSCGGASPRGVRIGAYQPFWGRFLPESLCRGGVLL